MAHTRVLSDTTQFRNLISQACCQLGFEVEYEHNGGLADGRRPEDIIVRRWNLGKDLLIDSAIIDPSIESHQSNLLNGPGEAATKYERVKLEKYPDIDPKKFEFLPFIIETHCAFGERAVKFCKLLYETRKGKIRATNSAKSN